MVPLIYGCQVMVEGATLDTDYASSYNEGESGAALQCTCACQNLILSYISFCKKHAYFSKREI